MNTGIVSGIVRARTVQASIAHARLCASIFRATAFLALSASAMTAAHAQIANGKYSAASYLVPPALQSTLTLSSRMDSGDDGLRYSPVRAEVERGGAWAVYTDVIYLSFDSESSRVRSIDFVNIGRNPFNLALDTGSDTTLKGLSWTLGASRTLLDAPLGTFDVHGGLRYLERHASVNTAGIALADVGRFGRETRLFDAVVGVRGRVRLGSSNWSVPYYADVGAGSSRLTWQGVLAFSYAFQWGDLALAYRHLAYDQDKDRLLNDFRFSGPTLGASWRF
jgi:hypothetical protein